MSLVGDYETKQVLVTARTYPTPSRKNVEVSCTGGITKDQEWIRLFPVPYRFLTTDRRFKKYQWIEVRAAKSSDSRLESYEVDLDSINILSDPLPTASNWYARKEAVFPLRAPSLCQLKRTRRETGATLGFFKPKQITKFEIAPESEPDWTPQERERLLQHDLFQKQPLQPLEKIPFKFYYHFQCDDAECSGHKLSCVDWEIGAAYRKWRTEYGDSWELKFRERFERDMIERCDTHFFVGTIKAHPHVWIIVGLFYPRTVSDPKSEIETTTSDASQPNLFDLQPS